MQGMRIDFISNIIIITKAFREAASEMNTPEYTALKQAQQDNPKMKVVLRSANAVHNRNEYKGLTYKYMRKFIRIMDKENSITFDKVIEYYEDLYYESGKVYQCVKEWFLDNYPNHKEMVIDTAPQRTAA